MAEAASTISDAVDPDATIISGLVVDGTMDEEVKVTVIATGFSDDRQPRHGAGVKAAEAGATAPADPKAADAAPGNEEAGEEEGGKGEFRDRMLAEHHKIDPGGYGPNWRNVDDYDIPTVLRKQMD